MRGAASSSVRPQTASQRQSLDAGGVELVAVDLPLIAFAPRRGRGQAAARRRTERGLDAQGIDQRALAHRIAQHALAQVRPASGCRCGAIAWCCSQVIVRISAVAGSPQATAASTRRAAASEAPPPPCARGATRPIRPVRLQLGEVLAREGAAAVVVGSGLGKEGGQPGQQRGIRWRGRPAGGAGLGNSWAGTLRAAPRAGNDESRISKLVFLRSLRPRRALRSRLLQVHEKSAFHDIHPFRLVAPAMAAGRRHGRGLRRRRPMGAGRRHAPISPASRCASAPTRASGAR